MQRESPFDDTQTSLQVLLLDPHESLEVEYKAWLDLSSEEDKANLAKAILALANHGGGHVVLGYAESQGNWLPAEPRPLDLRNYTQDIVNGIVQKYADPPFHCEVRHVPHPVNALLFPVVVIPGPHRIPIRAKRGGPDNQRQIQQNVYYIRRPGPCSESPQSGLEWNDLMMRCLNRAGDSFVNRVREIVSRPPNSS